MQWNSEVFWDRQPVGTACVTREGLYYRFRCECRFPDKRGYRLRVCCGSKTLDLGLCVPEGNLFTLSKRIPIKQVGDGEMSFQAMRNIQKASFSPVEENLPFSGIPILQYARLAVNNGQVGIEFKNLSEAQQGNGQNP